MDQTGSTRSYPTSTTARCRKDTRRRHKGRKRTGRNSGKLKQKGRKGEKKRGNGPEEERSLAEKD
eukprot:327207-Chlamydomonas_euryale.AAC.1